MERTLTVMGDSIAVGVGDPVPGFADLSWADQLAGRLGSHSSQPPRNLGVIGARLDQIVAAQLEAATAQPTDVTVVTGGGNDIFGDVVEWRRLEELLEVAVAGLAATGTTVVTFGLFDISCTGLVPEAHRATLRRRIAQLNGLTEAVTGRHDGCFVDFFDHPEQSPELFSADGLHPNRRAHHLIATTVHDRLVRTGDRPGAHGRPRTVCR